MLKHLVPLLVLGVGLVGCSPANVRDAGPNAVHMTDNRFAAQSVTIHPDETLTLVADTFSPHIIANGSWSGGTGQPAPEPGAPQLVDLKIDGGKSARVGPFSQPGTYHLYCTIHPGMDLTVTVAQAA
jgi:plastocyanin